MSEAAQTPASGESRLANVSAALIVEAALAGEPVTRTALLLGRLFEDVVLVGGAPPEAPGRRIPAPAGAPNALLSLVSALEASPCERVIVVSGALSDRDADLLLALTAWPQHDAVLPGSKDAAIPPCAIYCREPVLEAARRLLEEGEGGVERLLQALDSDTIDAGDLASDREPR